MTANNEIKTIQKQYLEIIESYFSNLWEKYLESRDSPMEFLRNTPPSLYSNEVSVIHAGKKRNFLSLEADRLLNDVSSFWDEHQQSLQDALKSSDRLNTQIGDLNGMSSYYSSASIRLGLYFDSVCLLDPLSIMAQRRETMSQFLTGDFKDPQLIYVILNYLEVRTLKPLLLSETDLPISILVPPTGIVWGDNTFRRIEQMAEENTYKLFEDALDRQVDSMADLIPIFQNNSLHHFEKIFRGHEVLKSLFYSFKSLEELIEHSSVENPTQIEGFSKLPLRARNLAHILGTVEGRFLALEGAETSAANLGIDLNIPREHWDFNRFRSKCNAKLFSYPGLRAEVPIQAAIMSEKMDWLSAATINDLVRMREKGYMEKIREVYRINRRDLQRTSPESIDLTTSEVVNNVTEALLSFKEEANSFLDNSSKDWFKKVGLFVVPGSLGIAAQLFPPLGWISTIYSLIFPGASITDMIAKYHDEQKSLEELTNRPIMHMLDIWDRTANSEK